MAAFGIAIRTTMILAIFLSSTVFSQNVDLNRFINDSLRTDVNNLNAALNSGLNSSILQRIETQSPFNINLSIHQVWIHISPDERQGPLANSSGFGFPVLQLEVGFPSDIHLIARGMRFHLGKTGREKALLWGVGVRYVMLHQKKESNIHAGVIAMFESLAQMTDFSVRSLLVNAYLGGGPPKINVYISPGITRSWYILHLKKEGRGSRDFRDTRIITFFKFSGGVQYHLNHLLTLTTNIVLGEFVSFSGGVNFTLF